MRRKCFHSLKKTGLECQLLSKWKLIQTRYIKTQSKEKIWLPTRFKAYFTSKHALWEMYELQRSSHLWFMLTAPPPLCLHVFFSLFLLLLLIFWISDDLYRHLRKTLVSLRHSVSVDHWNTPEWGGWRSTFISGFYRRRFVTPYKVSVPNTSHVPVKSGSALVAHALK